MKIATGKVVGGDVEHGFVLSAEDEAELLLSIAEADRGETIPVEEVVERLAASS